MCGIFAWVGPGCSESMLLRCTNRLKHRGPDELGQWSDGTVWLGHRRLKVIDLSPAGAQPMFNEDRTVAVVFNGEIYNFPELRAELESRGHQFRSKSDTEVIVHAYEEFGDGCVDRLWGMFAFAIWDQKKQRLLAARDRFGKKPITFLQQGQTLVLASELPAILETGLSQRKADLDALNFYWQLEYIPAPFSAFTDIKKLPAGHVMVFENGQLRDWRYYPPREVAPFSGSYQQAKQQLSGLLEDATRRRLVSDVPIGVALSGGIDSAIVTAAARKLTTGRLVTVTLRPHLKNTEYDEGDLARATAKALGTEHHEIDPTPDFQNSFEKVIEHLGEPFAISSAVPCYYLFEELKKIATVVVTGDGGDELFGGYDYYRSEQRFRRIQSIAPDAFFRMCYGMLNGVYGSVESSRRTLKNVLAGIQLLQDQSPADALWERRRALKPMALNHWVDDGPIKAFRRELAGHVCETDPMRRRMMVEQFDRMAYHLMPKVDITSMAHAVETRAPLLDHRVAEFARSLPNEFLVHDGLGKRILRDLVKEVIPPEVWGKSKAGFGTPLRQMFAGELRGYLTERLTAAHPVFDALINRHRMVEIIESHAAGRPYQTVLLLKLLTLRIWIEQTQPSL